MTQLPCWHFRKHRPDEKARNPIGGEFFAEEAIDKPGQALVREAIQNAMDAAVDRHDRHVHVKMFLSGNECSVAPNVMSRYAAGLWAHIENPESGIRNVPYRMGECKYLLIEDFGTTGLTGDDQQFEVLPGQNAFYHFFRADAITDKIAGSGGSWGVGKNVFPRVSCINGMFGLTVRNTDLRRLLMGTITLRHRSIDGVHYGPDGWYGLSGNCEDEPTLAIEDPVFLDNFCRDFNISRGNESPGLSIVIPWIDSDINVETLLHAVALEWFYPILDGQLTIEIESPSDGVLMINASTFPDILSMCGEHIEERLGPFVILAAKHHGTLNQDRIVLLDPDPNRRPEWTENMIDEDTSVILRSTLDQNDVAVVEVPLIVRQKSETPIRSKISICVMRSEGSMANHVNFIRDGIMIPHPTYKKPRGYTALIIAEDEGIANLLRSAEHPAHTHWSKDTGNFKDVYVNGPSYLLFVRNAAAELINLLKSDDDDEDRDLLIDLFSLSLDSETADDNSSNSKLKRKKKRTTTEIIDIPPPRIHRYRIVKHSGGFRIIPGDTEIEKPFRLILRIAYNTRRRSPLKKWHRGDFDLSNRDIQFNADDPHVKIVGCVDNRLTLEFISSEFDYAIDGFDPRRDLFVSARAEDIEE